MATTTFSGPIKAGTMANTTGSTVGTNVKNTGQVLMAQTGSIANTNTSDKDMSMTIPANSQIVDIVINVETAFNGGGADTLDIGISGNSDLYVDNADVSAIGPVALGTTGLCTNWKDVGTSDVAIAAKYIDANSDSSAGSAQITILYQQNNNLS